MYIILNPVVATMAVTGDFLFLEEKSMEEAKVRKGKSKEMINMIEAIYYGDLNLPSKGPKKDSEYEIKQGERDAMLTAAKQALGKEWVRKLEDAMIAIEEVVARDHFVVGFQWGAKMMLSILGNEPDTFGYQED